jgi:cell division protein FtsB
MPRQRSRRPESPPARQAALSPERLGRSGAHLVAIGMVVLSLWMLASFVGQVITSSQLERRRDALSAEIARLERENAELAADVAYAESPAYAERIAREQLGYAREGDVVVLPTFPDVTPEPDAPLPQPLPTPQPRSNLSGWASALFPTTETLDH